HAVLEELTEEERQVEPMLQKPRRELPVRQQNPDHAQQKVDRLQSHRLQPPHALYDPPDTETVRKFKRKISNNATTAGTARGSGWVFATRMLRLTKTHPLPRAVPTAIKGPRAT